MYSVPARPRLHQRRPAPDGKLPRDATKAGDKDN